MLRWLSALLLIPFLDAVLLAFVFSRTDFGWAAMVLLVVLTGLIGMLLVRAEGRRTLGKMQQSLAEGKPPTNQLLDGGLLIAAGAFLLTPGLVTDLIGFLLVVPITRIPIRAGLKRFVIVPYADKKTGGFASGGVYTFGFPNGENAGGQQAKTANTNGTAGATDATGGTYDLDEDAYTVESDVGDEEYTIEFGDEESRDDETDSDPFAR
ncbi:FxsA family protein [Halostagnicola sp. A-GB9-2]|uniref:FxsA family protein n=1 Tax=Halostagnicola sp. A-GB9-2 TaxID=3048066 RepID=UPI0024BFBA38|nr:FxsA family protein [Halostagnicola sp. A-GB9-2]MDJ1433025.1 FxsA family protein [Halostagnicola sp. A-GB9-2]